MTGVVLLLGGEAFGQFQQALAPVARALSL